MALLMREPVANPEQSHEHGEKLEEDRERGDEPTMAKNNRDSLLRIASSTRSHSSQHNNLYLLRTKYGTASSGVPPSQHRIIWGTEGAQVLYR